MNGQEPRDTFAQRVFDADTTAVRTALVNAVAWLEEIYDAYSSVSSEELQHMARKGIDEVEKALRGEDDQP